MSYSRGKVKYKLQMDEHKPDHTFSHPTPTFKYTRKNKHTNTKIYGDGVYWEIFIKIKNILFWFLKLPAIGAEIF